MCLVFDYTGSSPLNSVQIVHILKSASQNWVPRFPVFPNLACTYSPKSSLLTPRLPQSDCVCVLGGISPTCTESESVQTSNCFPTSVI